jgi:hypothetical protein
VQSRQIPALAADDAGSCRKRGWILKYPVSSSVQC